MKRLDLLPVVPLCLLALFVGHEALGAHQRVRALSNGTTSLGAIRGSARRVSREAATPQPDAIDSARMTAMDVDAGSARDIVDARRRLELSSAGTYIGDVLADRDSSVARWPDRRTNPLRVWVQPFSGVHDFSPAFVPIVRDAFDAWSDTGIPVPFTFVVDSTSSDVRVTWIDHFDEPISGKTLWAHDQNWWIVDAHIVIALHHKSGETLDPSALRAISLHEVGHLIGLDHTRDTMSIMTPKVRVKELSAADRATVQLLYLLPPGKIGAQH